MFEHSKDTVISQARSFYLKYFLERKFYNKFFATSTSMAFQALSSSTLNLTFRY